MTDLRLAFDELGYGVDLELDKNDLVLDEGLVTPVLHSLFCDRRADTGDPEPTREGDDPRGWWADTARDRYGSRLWMLEGLKLTNETLSLAREYAQEALQWLVDEGIADSVEIVPQAAGYVLELVIVITRGSAKIWSRLWDGTATDSEITTGRTRIRLLHR